MYAKDQMLYWVIFLKRHITLPVIPNGLQIMADQGFP